MACRGGCRGVPAGGTCWGPWPGRGGLTARLLPSGHGRAEDDCGDERARHREERLLGARLDRDQEKLLR